MPVERTQRYRQGKYKGKSLEEHIRAHRGGLETPSLDSETGISLCASPPYFQFQISDRCPGELKPLIIRWHEEIIGSVLSRPTPTLLRRYYRTLRTGENPNVSDKAGTRRPGEFGN